MSLKTNTDLETSKRLQDADDTRGAIDSADRAYDGALDECKGILKRFERKVTGFQWSSVGIPLLGAIAGAVLVPAFNTAALANKALVSALGGVSGVANTAQGAMRDAGLTSTQTIKDREITLAKMELANQKYIRGRTTGDPALQRAGVIELKSACITYSITAPDPKAEPAKPPTETPPQGVPNPPPKPQ
jgi:hypothetical protein